MKSHRSYRDGKHSKQCFGKRLRFEVLEGRELLSTVSSALTLSASNAPIWGGGGSWNSNYQLFNWTGPNVLVNNAGLTSPHADLSVNAWASTGTVSPNVGGNLSVTLPDTVKAGQKNVPITIKFSPTSESMSGLLGAQLKMPLNLSLGYQNLPLGIGTGKISASIDLVSVWDKYVGKPNIPQNFTLNTPLTNYSPAFGKIASDKGSATLMSGLQIDALQVAGYLVPAAALVDKAVAINLGTDLSATRTDNLTFSELDGTVTVNGTSVSYAIGSSLSTTVYVNIPSTAKSSVSVTIGNYKLKNDFYTQFGLTASPYLEVDGKVPFWGTVKLYRKDFPPINVTLFSTAHSQLNLTTGTTTSGTIKVQSLAYVLPASPAAPPSPASFKPQDLYFAALVSAPSPAPAQTDASANVVIDLPKAAKDTSGRQALNQVLAQTDGAELLQFRFVAPGLPGIGKR